MAPINLHFMLRDVETQNRLAREALDQAKALDAIISDPKKAEALGENIKLLIEAKEKFLTLSKSLSSNASTTSASVSAALTTFPLATG